MAARDVEDLPRAERPRPAASCPCERVLARHRARAGPDRSRRRRGGTEFHRARQRRAGVRHRARAQRADVAAQRARARPSTPRRPTRSAGCCSGTCRRATATACAWTPTGRSRGRSPCTPTRRRRGIRASTTSRSPTTATRTSPPATGRKLAIDVHPPTSPAGEPGLPRGHAAPERSRLPPAVPDADRVLGLRLRRPGRTGQRHRRARQPDGLRRRRREHARDRLLGRRVRLLRAAAEPRRLRRDRDDRAPAVGARTTRSG